MPPLFLVCRRRNLLDCCAGEKAKGSSIPADINVGEVLRGDIVRQLSAAENLLEAGGEACNGIGMSAIHKGGVHGRST